MVSGTPVAETRRPRVLFETGLPVRRYRLVRDCAWSYPYPNPEHYKIQDLICFYDERVEAVVVDGEAIAAPQTPWSRR